MFLRLVLCDNKWLFHWIVDSIVCEKKMCLWIAKQIPFVYFGLLVGHFLVIGLYNW